MGICFKEVSYFYPGEKTPALNNINLEVNTHDEFIFIIGHTGSGKSTLIEHFNLLKFPTKGNIIINDKLIKKRHKLAPIRRAHGVVFQFPEYQIFEDTVLKDIMFGPKNYLALRKKAQALARAQAQALNISESLFDQLPHNLSGGQMRKVAMAGILAMEPEMIILDEPTRGLDSENSMEVMRLLAAINQHQGKSIVIVSHDLDLAMQYAKRIIVMDKGQIIYDGSKNSFINEQKFFTYQLVPPFFKLQTMINQKLNFTPQKYFLTKEEYFASVKEYLNGTV